MSPFPDSNWVTALGKVERRVSGPLALAASVVFILRWMNIPPFTAIDLGWLTFIGVAGIVAGSLFLGRCAAQWRDYLVFERTPRPTRRFERLSAWQQTYLTHYFRKGSRRFNPVNTNERRFEELTLWNYVALAQRAAPYSGARDVYEISEFAWRRMAALDQIYKLPQ